MQVARVEHPDDEGPDLFGVPAPVAVPGALGPDGAGDEGEGPEHEAQNVRAVGPAVKRLHVRKQVKDPLHKQAAAALSGVHRASGLD